MLYRPSHPAMIHESLVPQKTSRGDYLVPNRAERLDKGRLIA